MIILGAGLAGCICATMNNDAVILEGGNHPLVTHKALLRFKSDIVSQVTGIPFKKVNIQKAIWYDGQERNPSPRFTAMYSDKVTGRLSHRSISNIDDEVRYIAPDNIHEMLLDSLLDRILFDFKVSGILADRVEGKDSLEHVRERGEPIISTLPIGIMSRIVGGTVSTERNTSSIVVSRYIIPEAELYTTVYFPEAYTSVYRASMTGNVLIIESREDITEIDKSMVCSAMGIMEWRLESDLTNFKQPLGKITEIDNELRRGFIFNLTVRHNVYSLGRFATWQNILLDEVVDDVHKIKSLMDKDHYEFLKHF